MRKTARSNFLLAALAGVPALCLLALLASYLSNRSLPRQSVLRDRLSAQEKAQLAEFYHLLPAVGEQVWPGFGARSIPVILYNEDHAFLVGMPTPQDGWVKVPAAEPRGGAWQAVPGDTFAGETYYRQQVDDPGGQIGAFTVRVGGEYAASLATLEWMRIALANQLRGDLPGALREVFPYRIFPIGTFTADWHVIGLVHEAFHAYQAELAPGRLDAAEMAERNSGKAYAQAAGRMEADWQAEFDLLGQAMRAESDEDLAGLARRFLIQREQRRSRAGLTAGLAQYEREREWLEGLAKYAELEVWRAGNTTQSYQPLPVTSGLESVAGYRNFERNWADQVRQLGQQSQREGDGRFYYSGWVQAVMLDRLALGWKNSAMQPGIYLENLLEQAVEAK